MSITRICANKNAIQVTTVTESFEDICSKANAKKNMAMAEIVLVFCCFIPSQMIEPSLT
jgi:hypothetical protein